VLELFADRRLSCASLNFCAARCRSAGDSSSAAIQHIAEELAPTGRPRLLQLPRGSWQSIDVGMGDEGKSTIRVGARLGGSRQESSCELFLPRCFFCP
jgi:hypothetical protein